MPEQDVTASQKQRLNDAVLAVIVEDGYGATTVNRITARARVSKATFYDLYKDKEHCFADACGVLLKELQHDLYEAAVIHEDWPRQADAALTCLLKSVAANPWIAQVLMVETIAAGPRVQSQYAGAMDHFLPLIDEGRRSSLGDEDPAPEATARVVRGGIGSVIYEEVAAGHAKDLPRLRSELLRWILAPYAGRVSAGDMVREITESTDPDGERSNGRHRE